MCLCELCGGLWVVGVFVGVLLWLGEGCVGGGELVWKMVCDVIFYLIDEMVD